LENVAPQPDVILRRWGDLGFVLVEIEGGVELRLAHAQFFHARFVVEGLVGLRLIIGEGFAGRGPLCSPERRSRMDSRQYPAWSWLAGG
jgi:hypothetical protein